MNRKSIQYHSHFPVEAQDYYGTWKCLSSEMGGDELFLATARDPFSGRTLTLPCVRYAALPHIPTHDGFLYRPLRERVVSDTTRVYVFRSQCEETPTELRLAGQVNPMIDSFCVSARGNWEPIRLVGSLVSIDHYCCGPAWGFYIVPRVMDVSSSIPIGDDEANEILDQAGRSNSESRESMILQFVEPPADRLGDVLKHMGLHSGPG